MYGFQQQDIAEFLGVSRSAVSMKFNGKVSFNARDLLILADHFGVSVDYLLGHGPMEVK